MFLIFIHNWLTETLGSRNFSFLNLFSSRFAQKICHRFQQCPNTGQNSRAGRILLYPNQWGQVELFWALKNTLTLKKGAITGEILRRTLATLNYFDVWILLNYGSVYTILTKVSWEILRPFFLQQCFFGVEKYRAFKHVQKLSYIPV